jgi:hypothetical protein
MDKKKWAIFLVVMLAIGLLATGCMEKEVISKDELSKYDDQSIHDTMYHTLLYSFELKNDVKIYKMEKLFKEAQKKDSSFTFTREMILGNEDIVAEDDKMTMTFYFTDGDNKHLQYIRCEGKADTSMYATIWDDKDGFMIDYTAYKDSKKSADTISQKLTGKQFYQFMNKIIGEPTVN